MANVSDFYQKVGLDYLNGGLTATRATAWGLALSTGVPTRSTFTEIAPGSGYAPVSMPLLAASSPAGTASNTVTASFGPFSNACTISGAVIKDSTLGSGTGNVIWFAALATARTLGVGDSLTFAVGSLVTSLV